MTGFVPPATTDVPAWWERRTFALLLIALSAMPLLYPALPPLTDLPGHMGRYHVALAIDRSAALQRFYSFSWAPIGNLGVDAAVYPLVALIGIEPATKLVVMAIPLLFAGGLLWLAREVHGRIPPSAAMALPFAYASPFQLGFVNFELAQALALIAFALWLALARQERLRLRTLLFVPISCLLWLAHDFGWGLFGLLAFGAELVRVRQRGPARSLAAAVLQCLPLALPVIAMLIAPAGPPDRNLSGDWLNLVAKGRWLLFMLRDRWSMFDALSLAPPLVLLYVGEREQRLGFALLLGVPALLCLAAFVLLPRLLMGGAYVDMRMAPVTVALALIAVRPPPQRGRLSRGIALAALAFFAVRTIVTTASFVLRSKAQQGELAAIGAIPRGAAVLALVNMPCAPPGTDDRLDHLAGMAIVRRDAFVNEQWALAGQQLLRVRYTRAAPYLGDPSQLVYPPSCKGPGSNFARAITGFDRAAFGYVWTLGFPPGAARATDLALVWTNGRSALYRVRPLPKR